jgi:hypothetical protein
MVAAATALTSLDIGMNTACTGWAGGRGGGNVGNTRARAVDFPGLKAIGAALAANKSITELELIGELRGGRCGWRV